MDATASAARPQGPTRSRRERVIQTLWFEALGLLIVSPLFAHFAGASSSQALIVLGALSLTMMGWSAVYNTAFDLIEARCTGRAASDRPHGLRMVHALGHEATAALVTWPLMVALTSLGWLEALVADAALTLTYAVYGYFYHLAFDRLRPLRARARRSTLGGGAMKPDSWDVESIRAHFGFPQTGLIVTNNAASAPPQRHRRHLAHGTQLELRALGTQVRQVRQDLDGEARQPDPPISRRPP